MDQQKKRENSGYLFRNANKRTDKQPDYRGKVDIGGKEWLLSGWIRNKDGEEMISIALTDPATLPPKENGAPQGSKQGGAGPFARQGNTSASKQTPPQPPLSQSAGSAPPDDMEDLASLFNGLDD